MSGNSTIPARASVAGAANAAENGVPSAEVRVRTPRSTTSPIRGGAGGRLSWSWHIPAFLPLTEDVVPGAPPGRRRVAAEDARGHLTARLREPFVLLVGLHDEPVEQLGVDPPIHLG